jgi:hypothetical protein
MDGSFRYANKIAKNGQGHFGWGSHVIRTSAPAANEFLTGWGEQRVPVTARRQRQRQPATWSAAVLIASMFAR